MAVGCYDRKVSGCRGSLLGPIPNVYNTLGEEAIYMPLSLDDYEQRRQQIAQQIALLGDLRAGSVTSTSGRCGKAGCRCHQPGQPGHGPNLRLTYKIAGKSVSESLPTPAAIHKAEREIAEFRKFQQLSREFVETNAEICRLRPANGEPSTDQEKKRRKRSTRRSRAK